MNDKVLDRPFLQHHLRRDRKRKAKRPLLITKIDVAQALRQRFQAPAPSITDTVLRDAINTSWDGRLYQSFSDNNPRGCDMAHRYQVMQFPESLAGKALLDIGCNLGRVCLDAEQRGAVRTVGIDHREDVMGAMNRYCRDKGFGSQFLAF